MATETASERPSTKELRIRQLVHANEKIPNALLLEFLEETHSIRLQLAWYKRNYNRLKDALGELRKKVEAVRADATHAEMTDPDTIVGLGSVMK